MAFGIKYNAFGLKQVTLQIRRYIWNLVRTRATLSVDYSLPRDIIAMI